MQSINWLTSVEQKHNTKQTPKWQRKDLIPWLALPLLIFCFSLYVAVVSQQPLQGPTIFHVQICHREIIFLLLISQYYRLGPLFHLHHRREGILLSQSITFLRTDTDEADRC